MSNCDASLRSGNPHAFEKDSPVYLSRRRGYLDGVQEAAVPQSMPDFAGLRKVIQAIENVPEEQFEMSLDCVWSRCAIAHFCRANPADALKLGRGGLFWLFPVPRLGRLKGDAAVYSRFGLLRNEDGLLFDPCEYGVECRQDRISRGEVIARIQNFIRKFEPAAG